MIKRKNSLLGQFIGLPGFDEIIEKQENDLEENLVSTEEPSIKNSIYKKNCLTSTLFFIIIQSTFLPLIYYPRITILQKMFYMSIFNILINYLLLKGKINLSYFKYKSIYFNAFLKVLYVFFILSSLQYIPIFKTLILYYSVDVFLYIYRFVKEKKNNDDIINKKEMLMIGIILISFFLCIFWNSQLIYKKFGFNIVLGFLYVIFSLICNKAYIFFSLEFFEEHSYQVDYNKEEFVMNYNVHIYITTALVIFVLGFKFFFFKNYFFDLSIFQVFFWLLISCISNLRWIMELKLKVQFDNFNLEKNFSYKFLMVIFSHFLMQLLKENQYVGPLEWVAYFFLLIYSLQMNSIKRDLDVVNLELNTSRRNSYRMSFKSNYSKNGSFYFPDQNN